MRTHTRTTIAQRPVTPQTLQWRNTQEGSLASAWSLCRADAISATRRRGSAHA